MEKNSIGIVGNGRVGSAVIDLFKKHYHIVAFDPLYIGKQSNECVRYAASLDELSTCIVTIVCVPTPSSEDSSCDTSLVESTVKSIPNDFIIIKSTVEPGTTDRLRRETEKRIVFSPEYVGESTYYNPYFNNSMADVPFVILGGEKRDTNEIIDILLPILGPTKNYFQTSAINAEMIKYVENTYFATKVTYVNEIYEICNKIGADWNEVREGWLLDPRVERMHTAVFPQKRGFGGKCYPKDLSALIHTSQKTGYSPSLLEQVQKSNVFFTSLNSKQKENQNTFKLVPVKQKSILVTGGAGFIGYHVAKRLIQEGNRVVIVDNLNSYYDPTLKEKRLTELYRECGYVPIYKVDIADRDSLKKVFEEQAIDKICHLAAQAGVRYSLINPYVYEETNVRGTLNLLELAKQFGIEHFIFASSASVYGGNEKIPFSEGDTTDSILSLYAATKKAGEALVHSYHKAFGLPATILRYFSVYGPWGRPDSVLYLFTTNILQNKLIDVYGHGQPKRDFTYVDDIANGTVRAIAKNSPWSVFNLGSGRPIDIDSFITSLEQLLQKKAKRNYLPMQPGDIPISFANNLKAKQNLNWEPTTLTEEGVEKYIKWYGSYYVK